MNAVPGTAAEYFGSMIREYDSLIRRAVPRYDEMLDRLVDYLPEEERQAPLQILELGCGTGNLSLRLRQRFPQAEIVAVDASPEMLEATRLRLAERAVSDGVEFLQSTFEQLEPEPQRFDLIVSSISLHHVAEKQPVYDAIFQGLRGGGSFRFSDQLLGASEWNHRKNWSRWLEFCRAAEHCSEPEVQSLLDHAAAHDHYTPLRQHFAMLERSGFIDVDCVWRNWIWGIVTADR